MTEVLSATPAVAMPAPAGLAAAAMPAEGAAPFAGLLTALAATTTPVATSTAAPTTAPTMTLTLAIAAGPAAKPITTTPGAVPIALPAMAAAGTKPTPAIGDSADATTGDDAKPDDDDSIDPAMAMLPPDLAALLQLLAPPIAAPTAAAALPTPTPATAASDGNKAAAAVIAGSPPLPLPAPLPFPAAMTGAAAGPPLAVESRSTDVATSATTMLDGDARPAPPAVSAVPQILAALHPPAEPPTVALSAAPAPTPAPASVSAPAPAGAEDAPPARATAPSAVVTPAAAPAPTPAAAPAAAAPPDAATTSVQAAFVATSPFEVIPAVAAAPVASAAPVVEEAPIVPQKTDAPPTPTVPPIRIDAAAPQVAQATAHATAAAPRPAPARLRRAGDPPRTSDVRADAVAVRADAAAPAQVATAASPANDPVARQLSIARDGQWLDSLARDIAGAGKADGQLHFRLDPDHLGSLTVRIAQSADGASIRLTASSDAAREILADAQPRLMAEARAQGLTLREASVDARTATPPPSAPVASAPTTSPNASFTGGNGGGRGDQGTGAQLQQQAQQQSGSRQRAPEPPRQANPAPRATPFASPRSGADLYA